ncbi:MAG: alpha/beta hydrolase [bacterium]
MSSKRIDFARHHGKVYTSSAPLQVVTGTKSGLIREAQLVSNAGDPDGFVHLLIHIFHPTKADQAKPVIILMPGMLCNSTLFRIPIDGNDYKNMDNLTSQANRLADQGFHVVLLNRRDSQWIQARFVANKLGVNNHFDPKQSYRSQAADYEFLIDAAICLSGQEKAAIGGFSMGGMQLIYLLAFMEIDPRTAGVMFLGTPVDFHDNTFLLSNALRAYSTAARLLPLKDLHALSLFAQRIPQLKGIVKDIGAAEPTSKPGKAAISLRDKVAAKLFFLLPALYEPNTPAGTKKPIIDYVLESLAPDVVQALLSMFERGNLFQREKGRRYLEALGEKALPKALVVSGDKDPLVTPKSHALLMRTLARDTKELIVPETGHVDLLTGYSSVQTVDAIADFAQKL